MESDAQLLDRYVTHREEAAFRRIVERHAGMVLGVARRRTGDMALAEEAGQMVFTLLARKAPSLRHLPPDKLGGWLHRTALLTAGNLLRSEMRRRIHHERFATENAPGHEVEAEESAWQAALPYVDDAIDSLPEAERQLVVQHFFQRRTFRELSTGTGRTEDALRKRAGRALERLSAFFKRRGIALSAAALTGGLGQRVAEAAPAGYAATTAATAVSSAPSVSLSALISNTLATMALSKLTVAAAAVAFLTPIGLHWSTGAPPPAGTTGPSPLIKGAATRGPARLGPRSSKAALAAAQVAGYSTVLARFAQELAKVTPPPVEESRLTELQRLVFALPEGEVSEALKLLIAAPEKEALGPVISAMTARLAESDPAGALRTAGTLPREMRSAAWTGALQVWARRDFDAAFAWACGQPEGEDRKIQLDAVYDDLIKRDPEAAMARLQDLPTEAMEKQYRARTLELWRAADPGAALAWLHENGTGTDRDHEIGEFVRGWAGNRPDLAIDYALKNIKNPSELEDTLRTSFFQWGSNDPGSALESLMKLPPELRTAGLGRDAAAGIAREDVEKLLEAAGGLPAGDFRDGIQSSAVARLAAKDVERAKTLLAGIASQESRRNAAIELGDQWLNRLKHDPEGARAWIAASPDIPEDMKKHFLNLEQP